MAIKKINSGYVTQTIELESRILKYFPKDYKYFFSDPLFGVNDFANKNTYIPDTKMEQQLDTFFFSPQNLLSVFIGYQGMGKSTILKNYLNVHSSSSLSINDDKVIFSKFNWNYNHLEKKAYHLKYIFHNINSRFCERYQIDFSREKKAFLHFLVQKHPDLLSVDCSSQEALDELETNYAELFEVRKLQFLLQKQHIRQFILVIDNIEGLPSKKRYSLIGKLTEAFRFLTESSSERPVIKILFSFRPDTLYEAQQRGCFQDQKIGLYIKQMDTINLEKYFNLKLKYYDRNNGYLEAWNKCLPLFMKVSQKYNRKYDQIIKKLCNYSVLDSMKIYSNILSNSRWMHDTEADYYKDNQEYFNIDDIAVNNITVIRAISCMEDEMFIPKRPVRTDSSFYSIQKSAKQWITPSPICNLLYSTESEDYSILMLYIIKFFYHYCKSDNLYGHIYQKCWDIIRIFKEIFYGIEDIDRKTSFCISYLFEMKLLDKSLKTKPGEETELTSQSRLYLTPRGEVMWEMLSWDSVLLEIFREDYYRDYSEKTSNNPFCSYILMHQGKQTEIFSDLIRMISELLEKEKIYRKRALENDTVTSMKNNFGEECVCAQLFEGLKQSMSYSGLIKNEELNTSFHNLQKEIKTLNAL